MDQVAASASSKVISPDSALPLPSFSEPILERQSSEEMIRRAQQRMQDSELRSLLEDTDEMVQAEEMPGNTREEKEIVKDVLSFSEDLRKMDEHKIPIEILFERLGLEDPKVGLSNEFARQRLTTEGLNQLTQAKRIPWYAPQMCVVIRDGSPITIAAEELVRGDIVQLKEGDRIPADLRIITSNYMKVENSVLTGESEHLPRMPECSRPDNALETQNLVYFGTMCVGGSGTGIVINVGDNTFMGRIAPFATSEEPDEATLVEENE